MSRASTRVRFATASVMRGRISGGSLQVASHACKYGVNLLRRRLGREVYLHVQVDRRLKSAGSVCRILRLHLPHWLRGCWTHCSFPLRCRSATGSFRRVCLRYQQIEGHHFGDGVLACPGVVSKPALDLAAARGNVRGNLEQLLRVHLLPNLLTDSLVAVVV